MPSTFSTINRESKESVLSKRKETLQVSKVVSGTAKAKATKKAKAIADKEAQRIKDLSRDSGTLSKAAVAKQAEIAATEPEKVKRRDSTVSQYIETVILSGDPFSVSDVARKLHFKFQSVRAAVLRTAARLGKKVKIESRGKRIAE